MMVSVIMIAWSNDAYRMKVLRQTLESYKAHTFMEHQWVIVDNGPAAQTDVIRTYHPDIHIIPRVNVGVAKARNLGARLATGDYLAFMDSDIGYFPHWLEKCVEALVKYPDRKLVASAVKNKPMCLKKYYAGKLDEYDLYTRCAGMAMVMRRETYETCGPFHERKTNVGHQWCSVMRANKYRFIHHPDWMGRHIARKPSYHYKKERFIPETGLWVPRIPKESK
jgi:glycosyltransferase involved in cell wall biosynthesis